MEREENPALAVSISKTSKPNGKARNEGTKKKKEKKRKGEARQRK